VKKVKVLVDALDRAMSVMTRNCVKVAIALLILLAVLVVLEVILRKLLGLSLQITVEYCAYLSCGIIFLGLAKTFRDGNHLRVEVLVSRLGPKTRRYADLWASVLGLICLFLLLKYTLDMVITSYQVGAVSLFILELIVHTVKLSFGFGDNDKRAVGE